MQEKAFEPGHEIICGLPCKFDDEKQIKLRVDKTRRKIFEKSQVSSRNSMGGNPKSECEIMEASVSVSGRNGQQDKCSEILEESVSLHSLNACTELKVDEHPSFTKLMQKAHVEAGFLMGIPAMFPKKHLPKESKMMTLETDNGEQYKAKYLPKYGALSGGWKAFALVKKLKKGDIVVFHLVEPTKFKVQIVRKNSSTNELPDTISNLYTKAPESVEDNKQLITGELPTAISKLHTKATESDEDNKQPITGELPSAISDSYTKATESDEDNEPLITYGRREARQPVQKSNKKTGNEAEIHFSNITGFDDFNTITTELLQNHEVSEITLNAYYKLCRSQNAFLHADLMKGLNTRKFKEGMRSTISKTTGIASTLRAHTLSSFLGDFSQWKKTLNYCEGLGMDMSFLRAHLYQLRDLAVDSHGAAVNGTRYMKPCSEHPRTECEVKKLEIILAELRKISTVLAAEVKSLESTAVWEKYLEACSRHIQVEDEIRETEGLLAEFGKFFEH